MRWRRVSAEADDDSGERSALHVRVIKADKVLALGRSRRLGRSSGLCGNITDGVQACGWSTAPLVFMEGFNAVHMMCEAHVSPELTVSKTC